MFDDPLSIVAAIAGGAVGLALVIRFGGRHVSPRDSIPISKPRPRPTGYAPTHSPTAAPVLTAGGLAVTGVGLALLPSVGAVSLILIAPGGGLLAAAALGWVRVGTAAARGGASEGDEGLDSDTTR